MSSVPGSTKTRRRPFREVLFATDLSDAAEPALIEAVRMARRNFARLHLLNVVVRSGARSRGAPDQDSWDHAPVKNRSDMELLHRSVLERYDMTVARIWRDTSLAAGILNYAERQGVDLIVIGPGTRSKLREAWRGSVTQAVVRRSPRSVLVPFGRIGNRRGILAPVDYTPESRRAMVHASRMAARYGQRLTVVHAGKRKDAEAKERLDEFVDRAPMECEARREVVTGDEVKASLAYAEEIRAEFIVLGAPQETETPVTWSQGTVAGFIRSARNPVLVYKRQLREHP